MDDGTTPGTAPACGRFGWCRGIRSAVVIGHQARANQARIYWEPWLASDDQPIEVSRDWALERIRLDNQHPAIVLRRAVQGRIASGGRIWVGDGRKTIRFKERAAPEDSAFSYCRVLRPLTSWRAITGQTALDTIGKRGMDVAVGMERLHNGEILRAGPYRVLATPISEHFRP